RAYAANFTYATLIPTAAAARSLERTASIHRPSWLRRRFATSRQRRTATPTNTKPRIGLGMLPSIPRNDAPEPRLRPPRCGWFTGEPETPAPQVELLKPNCSIATAPAMVTTARLTPRTRSAETPTIRPRTAAATEPASGPHGKPTP